MQFFYALPAAAQALITSVIAFIASALGGVAVFFLKGTGGRAISLSLGFSAGIMVSACIFSLLLPAVEGTDGSFLSLAAISGALLLGGAAIACGDVLLKRFNVPDGSRGIYLFYGGVTFHNVPEGISIGLAFVSGAPVSAVLYSLSMGIQNIPEGACLACALKNYGLSAKRSFLLSVLSSAIEPVFAFFAAFFSSRISVGMSYILSFSAGAMLAVVCCELIPEAFSSRKILSSFGFIVGFTLMTLLDLAF